MHNQVTKQYLAMIIHQLTQYHRMWDTQKFRHNYHNLGHMGLPILSFRIPMHTTQETLAGAFTVLTKFLALVVMWASVRFPI